MSSAASALEHFFNEVRDGAQRSAVFGPVSVHEGMLLCAALGCESEAFYRIEEDGGRLWVSFVTPDRWLSESIEADLMHTGDDIEDLLEEELIDQGLEKRLPVEHFRSEDKLFTFRSPLPLDGPASPEHADVALRVLLAYEACFRELGDVAGGEEE